LTTPAEDIGDATKDVAQPAERAASKHAEVQELLPLRVAYLLRD
jgi:hypothetical protein